ncbi:MAG: hypothetical protein LBR28_04710 [Bacteroidales bacterium]|jgi:ComF family protein|nr:hypothetical protein [Bacteroidales bacterium]
MKLLTTIYNFTLQIENALMPKKCFGCNTNLIAGEKILCLKCYCKISANHVTNQKALEEISTNFPVSNFNIFMKFEHEAASQHLIHQLKYHDKIFIAKYLAKLWAEKLKKEEWIKDIDFIFPLPLHWIKKIKRGYNQSEILATELGKALNKPVVTKGCYRKKYTKSQAIHAKNRWTNMHKAFAVSNPSVFHNKHVLIVDDVITTGSSVFNCMEAICTAKPAAISVACLSSV